MANKAKQPGDAAELRRRAEKRLDKQQSSDADAQGPTGAEAQHLLHELQVHQIELEMQNAELHETKVHMEILVDKYTDLYDFAPVGYFTVDDSDRILEANFTGVGLLGLERSLVVRRQLSSFVVPSMQAVYRSFLQAVFEGDIKPTCEVALNNADGTIIWVDLQGNEATAAKGSQRFCRLAASDITPLKRAEEAQSRLEALTRINQELQVEIDRRKVVERKLRDSENEQIALLRQARQMQEQLRQLSHLILNSQEEERRRISLELHDEVAQTLVGINVHLSTLAKDSSMQGSGVLQKIIDVQKLVEDSVGQVHQFAMKLRPPILDDLGLVPALKSFLDDFSRQTKIPVEFRAIPGLEQLSKDRCTILYRIAQEALTNIARHAKASQVELYIKKAKNTLSMEIHDNGICFDVKHVLHSSKHQRFGLIGMRERMEIVGGTFHIYSSPGEGTTVSVTLPLRKFRGKAMKKPT